MTQLEKVLYTGKARATGGRDGVARTDDGRLDVRLSPPGTAGAGTNPEQMFAAGYAACFIGALKFVAGQRKQSLPADTKIESSVGIGPIPGGFNIQVAMNVHIPGLEIAHAQDLVDAAHKVCPYSNATRGNVDVQIRLA